MTSLTLSPTSAKPGDTITATSPGSVAGESRTVVIVSSGKELARVTTKKALVAIAFKAPATLPAVIEARNLGQGCGQATLALAGPIVIPPPSTGIPTPPPATAKTLLRKDFADGTLTKPDGSPLFVAQDYPNVHEKDYDPMLGWNPDAKNDPAKRFRYLTQKYAVDAKHVSVHDGYLDMLADKQADGTYLAGFVASFVKNDGTKRNFDWQYGTMTWCARIIGVGPAAWQTPVWLLDAWRSPEIDAGEVIDKQLTVNLHSPTFGGVYRGPIPQGWAIYTLTRTPTTVSGTIAGAPWSKTAAFPARMPILLDAKYGLAYRDSTTPAEIRAQVAWIVVEAA